MSVTDDFVSSLGTSLQDGQEVGNNNRSSDGDANANKIQVEDKKGTAGFRTLSPLRSCIEEQDRIIVWGTVSQCDDPDLAEFEMLECQELEAYLAEEDKALAKASGTAEVADLSKSLNATEATSGCCTIENSVEGAHPGNEETTTTHATQIMVQNGSLENVFLSRLPTMSTSQTQENPTFASNADPSISKQSATPAEISTRYSTGVKLNYGSTILPKTPFVEAQEKRSGPDPCELRIGEDSKQSSTTGAVQSSHGHYCLEPKFTDLKKNPSKANEKVAATHSVPPTYKKQNSFERTCGASPTSLEKRKPWGSPSRSATPPSPRFTMTNRRQTLSSPAKTASSRAPSEEHSVSPQKVISSAKPSTKGCLNSSIPKPIPPQQPQRTETEKKSIKPKNVRPKIITFIPRSPQVRPFGHEIQKPSYYGQELVVTGIRPPSHTVPHRLANKSESFHGELRDRYMNEATRPQLGVGAVARQPGTTSKMIVTGQRSTLSFSHPPPGGPATFCQDYAVKKEAGMETAPKFLLPKPGQSGLRPPGFSNLPPAQLAALGCVRSASVSSVSSNQSDEGSHHRPSVSRKETERARASVSLKRCAVIPPKPQSAVFCGEAEDVTLIQRLKRRCEDQARQLRSLQVELQWRSHVLEVFSITTQHFSQQSESTALRERQLSLELTRIRDEVAFSVECRERVQGEKAELEQRFDVQRQALRDQQRRELGTLEERLRMENCADVQRLHAQQRDQVEALRSQHQELVEEMKESHEASLSEVEVSHSAALSTLQEEHSRTVKNLKMAHEQQKKSLEEEFEKLRLSLQDQIDTLTFQNRSLKDRAKRFEEALRRSTDEQIVDALAPYQHIEEDLKSLKDVLEMKNQQIHEQETKISELEKMAQKNVHLEERIQVLQQQNEDLKARIESNLAMSRQLTEKNANLQEHVEKESNEKKRLSRTNEELLWRLQTGDLSPRMSPTSSPVRVLPGPATPSHFQELPR
ncbi:microtubule-associated tumor suppressor candidate 2 isoform X2 [Denticeps clupeoides]|uniref:microtubule-associated tumor suppressor candidate 2 isoform X2 n=1 Tax=Denticeps clupeoides TaxID=299321 RepID=UPI0010A47149|nr:microtubule-associated tumor suppressor candidate 2-like isoform X2 [Denticeps clupeoides]